LDFFDDDYDEAFEVVERFWPKITSLRGSSDIISANSHLPSKHFDKLSVACVRWIG
jgi:hypothetical protein